jgi:tetratricopeptide (TPR) repeat protein
MAAAKKDEADKTFKRFEDRLKEFRNAGIGGDEVMWITHWLDRGIEAERALELAQSEAEHHKNVPTYTVLARAYAANGVFDEAKAAADRALVTRVQDPVALYRLAKVYAECGDMRKARTLATSALSLNSGFHAIYADEARKMVAVAEKGT